MINNDGFNERRVSYLNNMNKDRRLGNFDNSLAKISPSDYYR